MSRSVKIFIFVLGLWLGLTCFLDFFAVPTIFRTLPSREFAGKLGMILFSTFNNLEVLLAIILGICAFLFRSNIQYKKVFWSTIAGLFVLTLVYSFHMSPMIVEANSKKYELVEGSEEYIKWNDIHQKYHKLFRMTDAVKILALLGLFGASLKSSGHKGTEA